MIWGMAERERAREISGVEEHGVRQGGGGGEERGISGKVCISDVCVSVLLSCPVAPEEKSNDG